MTAAMMSVSLDMGGGLLRQPVQSRSPPPPRHPQGSDKHAGKCSSNVLFRESASGLENRPPGDEGPPHHALQAAAVEGGIA